MRHARDDYNRIQDPAGLIPDDEPVFLLRGQDKFAAQAVANYADIVAANGGDPQIVAWARAWAQEMECWRPQKRPDMPAA